MIKKRKTLNLLNIYNMKEKYSNTLVIQRKATEYTEIKKIFQ